MTICHFTSRARSDSAAKVVLFTVESVAVFDCLSTLELLNRLRYHHEIFMGTRDDQKMA